MKNPILLFFLISTFSILLNSCDSSKKATQDSTDNQVVIENEILAELKEGVVPRQLVRAFAPYKLQMKEAVSQPTNLWLFTYDTELIEPAKMIELVKASELVKMAEFNKRVKLRDTGRGN